ncbi:Hpt domain-containing protein [bacterium]|nr:Hpt domain-containing protein [bacterium]
MESRVEQTSDSNILLEQKCIKKLSDAFVFAEIDDLPSMMKVHTLFNELSESLSLKTKPNCKRAASAAEELMERIVLEDVDDSIASLQIIERTISTLQGILLENQKESDRHFPMELEKDSAELREGDFVASLLENQNSSSTEIVDTEILAEFLADQTIVQEDLEGWILELEGDNPASSRSELKRIFHNLKGESSFLGLNEVSEACHNVEEILSELSVKDLIDPLLILHDWLGKIYDFHAGKGMHPGKIPSFIKDQSKEILDDKVDISITNTTSLDEERIDLSGCDSELLAEFIPEAIDHIDMANTDLLKLETELDNFEALNGVFRAFHTIKGVAGFLDLSLLLELAHEFENLLDRARKKEIVLSGQAIDLIFDALDMMKHIIQKISSSISNGETSLLVSGVKTLLYSLEQVFEGFTIDSKVQLSPASKGKRLGEILLEQNEIEPDVLKDALIKQGSIENKNSESPQRLGEILVRDTQVPPKSVAQALRRQNNVQRPVVEIRETIRVDADKLGMLIDTIGELVIAESMISQSPVVKSLKSTTLRNQLSRLEKISRELQEIGTSLRMVPIRDTFRKMARLVRDLSKKTGKTVKFLTVGEDTELDKSVVERIGDPLVHLLRNAMDHGIEKSSKDRESNGKFPTANIELRAFHREGSVFIEIEDDGRGLNREAIRAKAIEKGLIREEDIISERELDRLIFLPGFSTSKSVTDISGRGVGMDVVKNNIESLRGHLEVISTPGKGTLFSIKLPLTLAIINGMVICIGQERYIIPTLSVVRFIRPGEKDISTVMKKQEMIFLQGKYIQLIRLGNHFKVSGKIVDEPTRGLIVIVEADGVQIGLLADKLVGQQQVVIKNLGKMFEGIDGIAGGTIMPDGKVGLILDPVGLLKSTRNNTVLHNNKIKEGVKLNVQS